MASVFDQIEIQSVRDNTIVMEISGDLLLQTLRHFEKANSDGVNFRLQKKDSLGTSGDSSRAASLAVFYTHINADATSINHTFKIPVRILKSAQDHATLQEPNLRHVDLMMPLPNEFVSTYKRLDKFRLSSGNDVVTIRSNKSAGSLGFLLEEEGKYKVIIGWNEKLDIREPVQNEPIADLVATLFATREQHQDSEDTDDKHITVKLKDWKMALKIVASCKTVVFLLAHQEACVLHCMLDDTEDTEVAFYINAVRLRD